MRRFSVICEWTDKGGSDGEAVEDADEVVVHADSESDAIAKATKKWRMTIGAEWPNCRLARAFAVTSSVIAQNS